MSRPRAEQLIEVLTEEEVRELSAEIERSGRESLRRLHIALQESTGEEEKGEKGEKETIFAQTFGRPWSKNEDYLLRNELRLLTEKVYELIIRREEEEEQRDRPGKNDPVLLRGLLHRRAFRPFESLYKKLHNEALQRHDYRTAHLLNEVWFEYLIHYCEVTPERMREAHQILTESLSNLKRTYRADVAENQHRRTVCEQNLLAMGFEITRTHIGPDGDLADHDTPLARYYDEVSKAHSAQGEERIAHAFNALQEVESIREIFPQRAAFGYGIAGSILFVERRYSEAAEQFEAGIRFAAEHKILPPLEMLFNYASTLMRLSAYRNVLDLLDEYGQEFQTRPKLLFRLECFRCFCHIFMEEPEKAFAAIPPDIQQRPESEYHYFRFIYLILPYLKDDPEGALRESRNFLVYFNRHKEKLLFLKEKQIASLYREFYGAIYNEVDTNKRKKVLGKILNGIDAFLAQAPEYTDYLYIRWLQEEAQKRMEGREFRRSGE